MSYRVLVPLDGSTASEAAIPEAERIAVGRAEVYFLHVVPPLPLALAAASAGIMESHDQALSYLEALRHKFPEVGGPDLIRTGEPADAILQVALEFDLDVIVMCTHARTGLAKWFMGSVAETVIQRAQLPVIVQRPDIPLPRRVLRRILVPLDGTEESFAILTAVKRMGLRTGAEIVLLHVNERSLVSLKHRGGQAESRTLEDPEHQLLDVAKRLGHSDLIYWQVIAQGDPVDEILQHATALDADLIAMSTHARSGQERTIFGSVAQEVLSRAKGAVLLQKPMIQAATAGRGRLP